MLNDAMIMTAVTGVSPIAYVPDERGDTWGPIMDSQIQPASLDVRLGEEFRTHPGNERVDLDEFFAFTLLPGECVLASLLERVNLPNDIAARVEGKSTWAREFLTIHSAGFIDPGFHGDVTLELKNDGRKVLVLKPGDLIAQISFHLLAAPAQRPYGHEGLDSHYQGQEGTTPSWRSE
jgi:dCTP deaminase